MRKKIIAILAVAAMTVSLAACSNQNEPMMDDGVQTAITDMSEGEVLEHEEIGVFGFESGEEHENDFYKRTTVEDENVYAVRRVSDGEVVNLPINDTVVYTSKSGECYYENVEFVYKEDGEEKTMQQYQLHVVEAPAA